MKKNLYAIYDKKSNNYSEFQWQDNNDECAIRTMSQFVNDIRPNKLNNSPSDYELYKLGEINLETGDITPNKEFIKNLVELKKPEDKKKDEILKTLRKIFDEVVGGKINEV